MRIQPTLLLLLTLVGPITLPSCGGKGSSSSGSELPPITPVTTIPAISQSPQSQAVTAGQTATFTVVATGTAPLSYQWNREGDAIQGATSASYTTPATTLADNGSSFTVTISNSTGSVTSSAATLTVNPATTTDITAPTVPTNLSANAASSTQINLTWTASTDNVSVTGYRIYRGGTQIADNATTSYSNTGLTASTTYSYTVAAYDAAGNVSVPSAEVTISTTGASESVHVIRRRFVSPITPAIKANLRAIKARGDALGRKAGILGQWGDSITNSNAYLGAIASWGMVTVPPIDGHDYVPILLWMGASANSDDNPLHNYKGGSYGNDSGWRITAGLDAIDDAIANIDPSWSLTMFGTNDMRQDGWNTSDYETRLERFLQINIDEGIVPVVSTIPPCTGWDAQVGEVNSVIRRVAARMNIPLVDLHGLFLELHPTDWATVLLSDGVHPSYTGRSGDLSEAAQRDDGYNLRTMLTVDMAEKIRRIVFENDPADGEDLPILLIGSNTHPYKTLTNDPSPVFDLIHDSGPTPTAYSWVLDQSPATEPDTNHEGTNPSITTVIPQPGVWYFHVRANSAAGWGPTAHYCVHSADAPTVELRDNGGSMSQHRDTFISLHWGGNDNFGGSPNMNLYNGDTTNNSRALFQFDLSGCPATGLQSALLTLNTELPITSALEYQVLNVTSAWTEGTGTGGDDASGVTWATAPSFTATPLHSGTLAAAQSQIQIDLTSLAQEWVSGTTPNHGIMLQHEKLYTELHIIAREYGSRVMRPSLLLRYSESSDVVPPSAPAGLLGTANGDNGVTLSWTAATDNISVASYRIYRDDVFINSVTTTSYTDTGLQPASTYSYAVRAVDSSGNEGTPCSEISFSTPTPALYAGPDRTLILPSGACLDAAISGIGNAFALTWTQVSGPSPARISYPTNPYSAAYFTQPGTYVFRCTAISGANTYTDDISFTVQAASTTGRTVNVSTVAQLRAATSSAMDNDTILLADGTYDLTTQGNSSGGTWFTLNNVKNVVIQSASGNPASVVISGSGFTVRGDNEDGFWIQRCACITVRGLTFSGFGAYAIKLEANTTPVNEDIRIENCRFLEVGMRCIKGTITPGNEQVHRGWLRDCYFENTQLPPETSYSGDYIAGLDMMALCNWEFSHNTFRNVKGLTAGGRAAIFLWHHTRGAVVERNDIQGCDRGIAFGNPGTATTHASWSIARNNLIVLGRTDGLVPDEGIELSYAENCKIHHNTVWRSDATARGIRCSADVSGVDIVNNLVRGQFTLLVGANQHHNIFGDLDAALFVNATGGDFHLASTAATAINQGSTEVGISTDFTGATRVAAPDLGAYEYIAGN